MELYVLQRNQFLRRNGRTSVAAQRDLKYIISSVQLEGFSNCNYLGVI